MMLFTLLTTFTASNDPKSASNPKPPVLHTNVMKITNSNYDSVVGVRPSIVKFYIDDCPYCQELAPEFQSASNMFNSSEIVFGEINCEESSDICKRHNIEGYPRIYYFAPSGKQGVRFSDERNADSIADFVEENAAHYNIKAIRPLKAIVNVNPYDFDSFRFKTKCAFLAFCDSSEKSCKRFMPQVLKASEIFEVEKNITIGTVNCKKYPQLCEAQNIVEIPTCYYFMNGISIKYDNPQNLRGIVSFINDKCGTERDMDGLLNDTAGLISEANLIVKEFISAKDKHKSIEEMKKVKNAEFYVKVMERYLLKGKNQIEQDLKKMGKILDERKGSMNSLDQMKRRYNIFLMFANQEMDL